MSFSFEKEDIARLMSTGFTLPVRNMDDFIKLGRYCILILICAEFMTLTSLANMVFMIYAGLSPTILSYGNTSLKGMDYDESCAYYDSNFITNSTLRPQLEYQFKSVNVEFGILCSRGFLVKESISIQMGGVLIGSIVAGPCSDAYGRKTVLMISLLCGGLSSLIVSYSSSFWYFTITRTFVGFFTGSLTAVQGVFLVENIPKKHRLWINTVITWSPNFIIFPFIAYLCGNWRTLSKFSAAISILAFVTLLILEESPRWRIHKGQIDKARQSLRRIRKIDGSTCETEGALIEHMLEHEKEQYDAKQLEKPPHQLLQLLKSKKYLLWTGTICYGIITASMINYALLFNMEKLSGSLYWNNTIFGIIRWIINIAAGASDYFFKWVGRKTINFSAMVFIIPALGAICALLYTETEDEYIWLMRFSSIGVCAMTSQMYLAKFMIASELFPTSVRNIAASVLAVSSRFATIVAPQLFYLTIFHPMTPYLVLLIISTIDFVLFQLALPETKGRNLENRMPVKKQKNILSRRQSVAEA